MIWTNPAKVLNLKILLKFTILKIRRSFLDTVTSRLNPPSRESYIVTCLTMYILYGVTSNKYKEN